MGCWWCFDGWGSTEALVGAVVPKYGVNLKAGREQEKGVSYAEKVKGQSME